MPALSNLYHSIGQIRIENTPVGTAFIVRNEEEVICLTCFHCIASSQDGQDRENIAQKTIEILFFGIVVV